VEQHPPAHRVGEQFERHDPAEQVCVELQVVHEAPPLPQVAFDDVSHCPVLEQHPEHVAALHGVPASSAPESSPPLLLLLPVEASGPPLLLLPLEASGPPLLLLPVEASCPPLLLPAPSVVASWPPLLLAPSCPPPELPSFVAPTSPTVAESEGTLASPST
jgi:hypothetical protein